MTVPSPCTAICVIEPNSGYCRGCLRTLREIAAWGNADDATKLAVIEQLKKRSVRKE